MTDEEKREVREAFNEREALRVDLDRAEAVYRNVQRAFATANKNFFALLQTNGLPIDDSGPEITND